jgi:serine-type D-Ala-D-Ala carboxypeptidase/endopeptidase
MSLQHPARPCPELACPARRRGLQAAAAAATLTGLASTSLLARAQTTADDAMPDLQPVLNERLRHEGVGYAAAQWQAGSAAPRYAFAGTRHVLMPEAPDANTRFEYGSITKTFVGLLLAQMVVQRELSLDNPAESLLPSGMTLRDSAGAPLRLIDLATHRSGLPRLPSNMKPAVEADPYADYGSEALWAFLAGWKAEVPRGSRFEYSNLGFGLLGELLGRRHGAGFAAALRERVLLDTRIDNVAQGHDEQRRPVPPWRFGTMAGAGALVGSAASLMRYAQLALGAEPNPLQEAFALATQSHAPGERGIESGLAWMRQRRGERLIVGHDGGTYGFSTSLLLEPLRQRACLVLANAFVVVNDLSAHGLDGRARLRDVAKEKREREAAAKREPVAVPVAALQVLIGSYALNPQFKLSIRVEGGKLLAQATGQGAFELFALSEREFFARVAEIVIRFDGDAGAPPALTLRQGGQALKFVRE